MSCKNDKLSLNYFSRSVSHIVNEHGDEIEPLKFNDNAMVPICQDKPPFKDYLAEAKEQFKKLTAKTKKALNEL